MRVAVLTWGSRGDFQPYVALAVALKDAGHEVRLAAPPRVGFSALAAQHALDFVPLGSPADPDHLRETANTAIATANPVKAVRLIMDQLMLPEIDQMYEQCLELARWADVVVSHFVLFCGRMAAERAGRPFVSGTLVPTQLPTTRRPPEGLPDAGRIANRLLWWVATSYMNAGWLGPVNEVRTRHGLPALTDVAKEGFYSPQLNLVAMSPRIFKRPPDWPPQHRMTGYWLLGTPPGWSPSPELTRFLGTGPRPIVVGFGSMTSTDSADLTRKVLRAVRNTGLRAVIEPGMAGLGDADLPPGVIVQEGVPHAWLLPRSQAIVHHGGAGTTGAAFHAGVPGVFVPHVFDQLTWAKRARELGVSPPPVPASKLTWRRLAVAIEQAVSDESIQARAMRLRERLQGERGAEKAVRLIEEFVTRGAAQARVESAP